MIINHDGLLSHIAKYWLYLSLHKDNTILRIVPLFNCLSRTLQPLYIAKLPTHGPFCPKIGSRFTSDRPLSLLGYGQVHTAASLGRGIASYTLLFAHFSAFFSPSVTRTAYQRHSWTEKLPKRHRLSRHRVRLSRFSRDGPSTRPGRRPLSRLRSRRP